MKYPKDLQDIITYKLKELIKRFNNREFPFNKDVIMSYKQEYDKLKKETSN
jgi:protein associated with RNAse G/E